jgi:hypothetical protein
MDKEKIIVRKQPEYPALIHLFIAMNICASCFSVRPEKHIEGRNRSWFDRLLTTNGRFIPLHVWLAE